jgi:hypothetical protein
MRGRERADAGAGAMSQRLEHAPGEPASVGGLYRQLNVFGTATEAEVRVSRGEKLPRAPIGFAWHLTREIPEATQNSDG